MSDDAPPLLSLRAQWSLLAALIAVYLLSFAAFYPPTHAIEDEVGFLNQAIVWSSGSLSAEGAGFESLADFLEVKGRHVGWRNPGRSLLTIPFLAAGGYGAVFVSGALLHVLLTLLSAGCLRRLGHGPLGAALVLAHPTLALYSRTIMADALGGLFLLVAFYLLLRGERGGLRAGIAVGFAAVSRYQLGLVLPFLALALWFDRRQTDPKREAIACLAGGGAVGSLLIVYNLWAFGHILGITWQGAFGPGFVAGNALHYGLVLAVLWPGMLLAPLLLGARPWRGIAWALTLPVLVLLLGYYWYDQSGAWWRTVVLGQRLLQPALPVWIVLYVIVLTDRCLPLARERIPDAASRAAVVVVCAALAVGGVTLAQRHQRHLREMARVQRAVEANLPTGALFAANRTLSKLVEVPRPDRPRYRVRLYEYRGGVLLDPETVAAVRQEWFLGHLAKPGQTPPPLLGALATRYHAERIPVPVEGLWLYRVPVSRRPQVPK